MITQKDLEQLALLKAEAERTNQELEQFQQEVAETVTEIAFKHYPTLKEMSAEEIQRFGDILTRNTWDLALHVEHVASNV